MQSCVDKKGSFSYLDSSSKQWGIGPNCPLLAQSRRVLSYVTATGYRKDSMKPPGVYLLETILRAGACSRGAYSKEDLLNLMVLGSAKHNILYYLLHSQIAVS